MLLYTSTLTKIPVFAKSAKRHTSDARSNTFQKQFNTQEYFAIRRRYSLRRVCETQISKNTQAYFGDRRMLRTGFVFDEPLRTPTYSTQFHTQAYRSGHNEAVLKTVRGNSHGGSNPSACAKKHQLFGWCFSIFCIKGFERSR